jgi:hypothetical protein
MVYLYGVFNEHLCEQAKLEKHLKQKWEEQGIEGYDSKD